MHLWHARYMTVQADGAGRVEEQDFYMAGEADVRRLLIARGAHPIRIKQRRQSWWRPFTSYARREAVHLLQAISFQAETAPPAQALKRVIDSERNDDRRIMLTPARTVLESGGDFAAALSALQIFDPITLALIVAGERSGTLRDAIAQAVEQIHSRARHIRSGIGIAGFLTFDIVTIISSLHFAYGNFLPTLVERGVMTRDEAVKASFESSLAVADATILGLMLLAYLFTFGGGLLVFTYARNRNNANHWAVRFVQSLPLFAGYFEDLAMASSWSVFARLLKSSVMVGDAMKICAETAWVSRVRGYWLGSAEALMAASPREALMRDPLESEEKVQVATHVTTDQLSRVSNAIAERREERARKRQKRIISGALTLSMAYLTISFGVLAWLTWLQQSALSEAINYMRRM